MLRLTSWMVIIFLSSSCTDVLWVKEGKVGDKASKLAGVPFYFKTERFIKSTAYADTWLRAVLTVEKKLVDTKDGKEVLVDRGKEIYSKDVEKPGETLNAIKRAILAADDADVSKAKQIIDDFNALAQLGTSDRAEPPIVRNAIDSIWVVDSTRTYYLNAPLPWFGTGNLSQELNADGTLLKATSNPDTKLAEGISKLIPFKEFLTGRFVKAAPAAAAADAPTKMTLQAALQSLNDQAALVGQGEKKPSLVGKNYVYLLSLDVSEIGYEYTLTSAPMDARPDYTPLAFGLIAKKGIAFSRKEISADNQDGKKESTKDDGQKVGISGSINFPKDWGAAAAAGKQDDKSKKLK